MDALIAVVAPEIESSSAVLANLMFNNVWPPDSRHDVVFASHGIMLAAARTKACSDSLGRPQVRELSGEIRIQRWDWPTVAQPVPLSSPEDRARKESEGTRASGSPASISWLPASRTLVAYRDALGEGSLWYSVTEGRLALASHPALLLALEWVSDQADPIGGRSEGFAGADGERSPWRMIRRLPAGHRLSYGDGQVRVDRWWHLSLPPIDRSLADAEWIQRARGALERAVARRTPAAETVGAQLSGGLDSTAVSLIASRRLSTQGRALHTFSHLPAVRWNPPRPGDETPFVEAALERMPNAIPHSCTDTGGQGSRFDGRPLLAHDHSVRGAAREAGVGCMLSGWGGDEGISYNGDGFLAGQLLRLHLLPVLRWCWSFGGCTPRGLMGVLLYKVIYQQLGFLRPTAIHPDHSRRAWREGIQGLSGEARTVALQSYRSSRRLRAAASAHENQRRLLTSPHIANRIDSDAEWSIPAGFCFRYPLLDPEVIQVALQVPERLLVLNGRTRTLLREAMRGLYPELIQNRHGKFVSHPRTPVFRAVE